MIYFFLSNKLCFARETCGCSNPAAKLDSKERLSFLDVTEDGGATDWDCKWRLNYTSVNSNTDHEYRIHFVSAIYMDVYTCIGVKRAGYTHAIFKLYTCTLAASNLICKQCY